MSAAPRVVVIVGASSGIGEALAKAFAAKPAASGAEYRLVLVARREAELKRIVDALNAGKKSAIAAYFVADAASEAQVQAAADFAVKTFGRIDVWVNNAGAPAEDWPSTVTVEQIDKMMRVNVHTAVFGSQAALRVFKSQSPVAEGSIVNVSSVLGRNSGMVPSSVGYNAAKHFLNGYTDALRAELQAKEATKGVSVLLYSPGPVATDIISKAGMELPAGLDLSAFQDVNECAEHFRHAIETKREDAYSREEFKAGIIAMLEAKN